MKIHQFLETVKPILQTLADAGVRLSDLKYLEPYKCVMQMKEENDQTTDWIVEQVSLQFNISKRSLYQAIKKLDSNL